MQFYCSNNGYLVRALNSECLLYGLTPTHVVDVCIYYICRIFKIIIINIQYNMSISILLKYVTMLKNAKLCYNRISWGAWFLYIASPFFKLLFRRKFSKNCSCMYVEMANIKTHPLCGSFIEYTYFWNLEEARIMVKECLQKAVVLYAGLELEILSYTQDQ